MVELNELLHAVNLLIHLGSDEAGLFLFPAPKCDPLFAGRCCSTKGHYERAIGIDIKGKNSFGMRVEDGLSGSSRVNVPNDKHGIFSGVSGDDYVSIAVVSGC